MTELKQQDNNPWGKVILPAKQTFRLSAMLLTLLLVLLNTGIYFYQELYVSPLRRGKVIFYCLVPMFINCH